MQIPNAKLYLVGGSVRDTLLGVPVKDKDYVIITDYTFDELVAAIEAEPNSRVFLAKPEFLTIRCQLHGEIVDIAYPRIDGFYADSRHPTNVNPASSLAEDASRRDFTMNALFYDEDYHTQGVVDYHNGVRDINDGIIRAVGEPWVRFAEDPLRILRAVRFMYKLGFSIHPDTYDAMRESGLLLGLPSVSPDRIREELNATLKYVTDYYKFIVFLHNIHVDHLIQEKGLRLEVHQ